MRDVRGGGAASAQVREQTLRWTTQNPADHPISQGGQKFAELVAQKSGGKMQVKLFPGGVLGGDVQVLSAVQGGTIDMTSMNSGILQGQVKEFAIVDFPFLFNDAKEADAIMDGPIGKALSDKLPEKGLVNLAYFDLGFRNVTNSKRLIKTADDIAGLKIRVIQSPIYIETFNTLGANAVPMPFPEVYTALEQKTIDGQENPYTVIAANKINEVQKYLAATRHIYNPQSMFISKKTWDRLNKDEQDVLLAAAKEAQVYQRKVSRDAQDVALANLKKTMEYSELPPAEIAKVRTKLKPVIDKFSANVGADFAKQVYAEIDKVRARSKRSMRRVHGAGSDLRGTGRDRNLTSPAVDQVRIAVAGAGAIGLRHIDEIRESRSALLAGIVDPLPKAAGVAAKAGVPLLRVARGDAGRGQARRHRPRHAEQHARGPGARMHSGRRAGTDREADRGFAGGGPAVVRRAGARGREGARRPSSPPQPDPAQGVRDRDAPESSGGSSASSAAPSSTSPTTTSTKRHGAGSPAADRS